MSNIEFLNGESKPLRNEDINSREELMMYSLSNFYSNEEYLMKIVPIINGKSNISLRIIEWFILTYSRDNKVLVPLYNKSGMIDKCIYVYNSYKNTLKSFHGTYFGIFKRAKVIKLKFNDTIVDTTIGQLNFFKWILENNILSYIERNLDNLGNILYKTNKSISTNISHTVKNDADVITIEW